MLPLKLLFQLPHRAVGWKAELELIRRFEIVSARLGHECFSSSSAQQATELGADVIFNLHFSSAKITPIFTVGLVWNPLEFLRNAGPDTVLKTLSLDGHLYGGQSLRNYFSEFPARGYRIDDLGDFYPSAPKTEFAPPEVLGLPTYIGSLWQDDRHLALFRLLNRERAIHGFGPGHRWADYGQIYQGSFPLDGTSYQSIYRRSGIGLCLHSREHLEENVPAMRIFEIVASGCVAICDKLPFVEKEFGDSVLYLNPSGDVAAMASQLREIVADIHAHPARARERARAAHEIFVRKFSLDHLLESALEKIARQRETSMTRVIGRARPPRSVQIFTRTRGSRPMLLRRALGSLAAQTHRPLRSTLIYHGTHAEEFQSSELPRLREEFPALEMEVIQVAPDEPLGATIPAALRHATADFIGFVDDDDWLFPDHVATLVDSLETNPSATFAISGAVVHTEYLPSPSHVSPVFCFNEDLGELLSFQPLDFSQLKAGDMPICSNMILLRNGLDLDWLKWPRLEIGEDRALLALLASHATATGVFTSRVSCVWSNRQMQCDNQVDRIAEPGFAPRTALFTYKVPLAARQRTSDHTLSLYPWRATTGKCEAIRDLLAAHRWLPRRFRPYFYQKKFDALVLSMMEDWTGNRLLALPNTIDLERLKRMGADGSRLCAEDQAEFDQAIRAILATRDVRIKSPRGRHAFNLETARALEHMAKLS